MFSLLSVIVLWMISSGIFSTTATDKFFRQRKGLIKKTVFQASAYDNAEPTGLLSVSLYFICMEEFSLEEVIKGRKSPEVLPARNQEYTFRLRWNWIQGAAKIEMLLAFRWLWCKLPSFLLSHLPCSAKNCLNRSGKWTYFIKQSLALRTAPS